MIITSIVFEYRKRTLLTPKTNNFERKKININMINNKMRYEERDIKKLKILNEYLIFKDVEIIMTLLNK